MFRLELMMSMRFGQQSRRKTPITPGSRQRPKSKRSTFDDFSSIVEDPVEELDEEVAKPIGTNLQSEPIVRILPSGLLSNFNASFGIFSVEPLQSGKKLHLTVLYLYLSYIIRKRQDCCKNFCNACDEAIMQCCK